jgi:membrane-associated phospholipid phosphatase
MDLDRRDAATGSPSPLRPLVAAFAGVIALGLVGLLSLGSDVVRRADMAAKLGFQAVGEREGLSGLARATAGLADPGPVVLLTFLIAMVALGRGRPRTGLGVVLIALGANLTTQVLKPGLATPRISTVLDTMQAPTGAWPSGHATGAMTIALCAVLVAAPRWRPAVGTVGAVFAVAVGYGLLAVGAHFPSDVLGGYLVAAVWVMAGAAALRAADRRWPARSGRAAALRLRDALTPPLVAALGALCAGTTALVLRPEAVVAGSARHPSAVAAGLAVGAVGLSVATASVLALRR